MATVDEKPKGVVERFREHLDKCAEQGLTAGISIQMGRELLNELDRLKAIAGPPGDVQKLVDYMRGEIQRFGCCDDISGDDLWQVLDEVERLRFFNEGIGIELDELRAENERMTKIEDAARSTNHCIAEFEEHGLEACQEHFDMLYDVLEKNPRPGDGS